MNLSRELISKSRLPTGDGAQPEDEVVVNRGRGPEGGWGRGKAGTGTKGGRRRRPPTRGDTARNGARHDSLLVRHCKIEE